MDGRFVEGGEGGGGGGCKIGVMDYIQQQKIKSVGDCRDDS
jgi:hypothetical protein